ncbi:MAG: glycosyltransferase family 4 protein [Candidatus Omnitrophota bacterium]|nr:MAG: glycosyltransferase family 4 protein [Candidatus Omnitrophota bacterium]
MKIIQIPYCFYPDAVGGTEVYVESLSRHLQKDGFEVIISAPTVGLNQTYFHNALKVRRFTISQKPDNLSEFYGKGDRKGAEEFAKIVDEEKPDLVHIHAFTWGISVYLVREIKKRNIPVVFTYHTPTASCQRGTLLFWGKRVCDGKLLLRRCTRCVLHGLGLPRGIAQLVSYMPVATNDILQKANFSGGIWTALRMSGLISIRQQTFGVFTSEADHIIAVCEWVKEVLSRNGVSEKKISVVRQGLSNEGIPNDEKEASVYDVDGQSLHIIYLGRVNPIKGIDVILRAIKASPKVPIELHIYGVVQSRQEQRYLQKLKRIAASDPRILFKNSVSNEEIMPLLKRYHALAVPSQWLETGPLVVLEAFSARIPVIGSNRGGIAELVKDGVNGILVKAGDVKAWSKILKKCCNDKKILGQLRLGIYKPHTMNYVASEIKRLYIRIINGQSR